MESLLPEILRREPDPGDLCAQPLENEPLRRVSVGLVGNVITQPFAKLVAETAEVCLLEMVHLPFGQVIQALSEKQPYDVLLIHLDHRWFFDVAPDDEALQRADELADRIAQWLAANTGSVILNTVAFIPRSPIESDLHRQIELLSSINRRLFDIARSNERVNVIDVVGALARVGHANAVRERNRYVVQFPYAPAMVSELLHLYSVAISARLRPRRKVVVVDADNTLWGGVLGESGADSVVIDQNYPGILYHIFQRQLSGLRAFGIVLCVVTKNNESDFLEIFEKRTMPLKLEDFVTFRSNWLDKSENIRDIAEELNLGLDSFIFIDDNPFEIEEVRARLPGVECHRFPADAPDDIAGLLAGIESLYARSLTAEDAAKTEQYRAEATRRSLARTMVSMDDYLASLDLKVHVSCNNPSHVRRVAQLTNKTNQFNLVTVRYTEADIEAAMANHYVYDFSVADRFGDMGIVGVVIVKDDRIDTLLMSCRALGRKVESLILRYVCDRHADVVLKAIYRPTAKNPIVSNFYEQNGFVLLRSESGSKYYEFNGGPDDPGHVTLITN